jgi:hypothetical protein
MILPLVSLLTDGSPDNQATLEAAQKRSLSLTNWKRCLLPFLMTRQAKHMQRGLLKLQCDAPLRRVTSPSKRYGNALRVKFRRLSLELMAGPYSSKSFRYSVPSMIMTSDATRNSVSVVARRESPSFFQTDPLHPGTGHPLFQILPARTYTSFFEFLENQSWPRQK